MRQPAEHLASLAEARAQIDAIDADLLTLLAERAAHVERVTELKAETGVSATAPTRFGEVIASVRVRAELAGVDADMVEAMWRVMIAAFIAREQGVLGMDGVDG